MTARWISSEYRAVGRDRNRRRTVRRAQLPRDLAPSAPGAALQHLRHGEARIQIQPRPDKIDQWIHQRDRQRAPFDHKLRRHLMAYERIDRLARADHAEV